MTATEPFSTTPTSGYLQPGIHPASREEIKSRYGTQHPFISGSKRIPPFRPDHREILFSGYERLSEALEAMGITTRQWIGGSFISHEPNPSDIDLVNFCDAVQYESLPPEMKAMINVYFMGQETAKHCHCDSHFAPLPPDHLIHSEEFQTIERYWKDLLGYDRAKTPKGIVEAMITPPVVAAIQEHKEATREVTS